MGRQIRCVSGDRDRLPLGAGLFADEMNFQVLNIALLCIVFRVGMPIWLLGTCLALLVIDVFTISYLIEQLTSLVQHAG